MQRAVQDGQVLVRRDHVDVVRFDGRSVLDLVDWHLRAFLQYFGQDADVRRIQMDYQHKANS